MAGRRAERPASVAAVEAITVEDPTVDRALSAVRDAVGKLQTVRSRFVTTVDLIVGRNRVQHSLGRPCIGYCLTPTVADATFAHAIDLTNPHPDLEVWITVVGVAQLGARVEAF